MVPKAAGCQRRHDITVSYFIKTLKKLKEEVVNLTGVYWNNSSNDENQLKYGELTHLKSVALVFGWSCIRTGSLAAVSISSSAVEPFVSV